jgi:hypothetical protein
MIGKVITSLLTANTSLLALVPAARIFPYVMNEHTPMPAIIYTIDSLNPTYTKDGWAVDEIPFSVVSFSKDYAILQDIVIQVRLALEWNEGSFDDVTIKRIYVTGMAEGFNLTESVFMNRLSFKVEMNSY